MSRLQQACLSAAVMWVGMHLWHGWTSLDRHAAPGLGVAALVIAASASAWAASPLITGRDELSRATASVQALMGVAVTVMVLPYLDTAGIRSYADWPAGGLGVLIAALVMRGRRAHAGALTGFVCSVIVVRVTQTAGAIDPVWSLSLCVPPLLWLGATALVRHVFDRASSAVQLYAAAETQAEERADAASRREADASDRRRALEREALPLLRELAASCSITRELARSCEQLELRLRDDLRGHAVLDADIRRLLHNARAAGTIVSVVDDRDDSSTCDLTATVRELIGVSLPHLRGGRVTYRLPPGGEPITVVAEGEPDHLSAAADRLTRMGGTIAELHGGVLFARCSLS